MPGTQLPYHRSRDYCFVQATPSTMHSSRTPGMWLLVILIARRATASDIVVERQKAACTGLLSGDVSLAVESNVELFVAG